jgi:hypothetical protein
MNEVVGGMCIGVEGRVRGVKLLLKRPLMKPLNERV